MPVIHPPFVFRRTLWSLALALSLSGPLAQAQDEAQLEAQLEAEPAAATELALEAEPVIESEPLLDAEQPDLQEDASQDVAQSGVTTGADGVTEIQVIGKRQQASEIAVQLTQFGNQVQVLGADDIAAGGFTNFAELAQGLIKGANVGYSPDEGEFTIRLDGGSDRDTLVVLDDVPLYDRGPGVEDIWGTTLVDPHMIESVEVYRGGQSLYFGSNAGIGLVSIKTKKPDGTRKGEFGFSYGSFKTRELWGNYSFPLTVSGDHSVMVYGGRTASDNPVIFDRESQTDNHLLAGGITDYASSRDNIGAKHLWKIDDSSQVLTNVQYTQTDFQDTFPNTTIYGPTRTTMPLFNVAYDKEWSSRFRTNVIASYRKPELINTKFVPEICRIEAGCPQPSAPTRITPFGNWTGNLVPQAQRGIGTNSIPAGFEEAILTVLNHFTFSRQVSAVIGLQSTNYRDSSDSRILIDDDVVSNNALIVDVQLTPTFSPNTSVSLAVRVDNEKSFGTETLGKYGFRQGLPGGFYVRANGGTSFSLPRTNELFATTETVIGNPDLKPEETKTLNYGFGRDFTTGSGSVSAELGGFRTDISGRIQTTTGLTPNTRFNNEAVTEIRGVVADVQYQVNTNWYLAASYTQQKAELENVSRQIDSTPEWFATGQVRYRTASERYQFSVLPRLQGPTYVQAPAGTTLPNLNFGDWFVLNSTAEYWMGDKREHRFQLRGENLLDEEYSNRGAFGNQFYGSAFNRGAFGNQFYGSAFNRGDITSTENAYFYPYEFQAKGRSYFVSYSYSF